MTVFVYEIKVRATDIHLRQAVFKLNALLGSSAPVSKAAKPSKKKGMSAAGRAAVSAAAKLRWAKIKAAKASPKATKPAKKKFKMSAAAKAKISAAAKARWAAKKSGQKK